MPIPWHRDHTREPGALRAMIYNENKNPTFKVFHPKGGTHYVDLPEDSNLAPFTGLLINSEIPSPSRSGRNKTFKMVLSTRIELVFSLYQSDVIATIL
jgi:hypothetical protein